MPDPTFQPDELDRILERQAGVPESSDPAWPFFTAALIALALAVAAITGLTGARDDIRATRRAVEELRPCR